MAQHIRYFIGRSGTGKTQEIYKEVKALQEKKLGSKGFLIVPEQLTLQSEQALSTSHSQGQANPAEVALTADGGIGGVTITSFSRLIHQIIQETGLPKGQKIDSIGKAMIVKKTFVEQQKNLEVFSKVHERAGFIQMFSDFLSELKSSGISPETLENAEEGLSTTTRAKLRDTALIYKACSEKMAGQFVDEEDLTALMVSAIPLSERLQGAHIWIDGFYFFNGLEQQMIQAFGKCCESLTIALTFDPTEEESNDIFWAPRDAFNTMHQGFQGEGITETKRHFEKNKEEGPADSTPNPDSNSNPNPNPLEHLENNLFQFPGQPFSGSPSEHLILNQFESPLQEMTWVLGEIRRLVIEENVPYRDIAVIHQQPEVYHPLAKRLALNFDIPVFVNERRQMTNSPLVTYLRSLLELFQSGWKAEALFRVLKSGIADLDKNAVDRLEIYAVEKGLRGKKWQKLIADETIEPLRLKVVESFSLIESQLKACETVKDYTNCLWDHLEAESSGIQLRYEGLIQSLAASEDYDGVNELVQAWKGVVAVFDQLYIVSGNDPMDLKTYSDLLHTAFSLKEIGVLPPNNDRVIVGSMDQFRSKNMPYVFFVGFNDGWVPSIQDGSGILADEEKVKLRILDIGLKSDGELMAKNELFLIYQSLTRASHKLWISSDLSDTAGKPLRPSMYWDRLKQVFPDMKPTYLDQQDLLKGLSERHVNALIANTAEGLRRMVAGYPEDPYWIERFDYLAHNEKTQLAAQNMYRSLYHDNQPKPLKRESAKRLYGQDIRASVTRLEAFNACPFSHFVRFGLRPKRNREFELSLPDMGNLFHQSVEHFAIEALLKDPEAGKQLGDAAVDQMMDRIVEDAVSNSKYDVFRSDARSAYMVNKLKRTGRRAAKLMLKHLRKGVFDPKAFEVAFGTSAGNIPPICVALPTGENIYLEGRIDRVDVYDSGQRRYIKVIDYKSGSKKYNLGDVYNGLQIQLMVYMDAVLSAPQALKLDDPLYPAGVFYFKIEDPMVEGEDMTEEEIAAAIVKQLKMDGLVVGDRYVAAFMDEELKEDGSKSDVIPFEVKKEGEPGKYASYLSEAHFEALRQHVREGIEAVCTDMVNGQVAVSPFRCGTDNACMRCDYKGLCQFDLSLAHNAYRNLNRLEKEDLLEKLEAKCQKQEVAKNGQLDKTTE